jgi:acetylornithine/N-succinyldiaminopimelate aminotransferase
MNTAASEQPRALAPYGSDATAYGVLAARWDAVMMPNYGTPPVALVRGEGCTVWDAEGTAYLDLVGGIAVSSLGHAHPAVVQAVQRQVATLAHTSNLAIHEPGVRLAERLVSLLGSPARVFLCQDGATANEAALKLVRRHGWRLDPTGGRQRIVATDDGFHGRTIGALSVTGLPAKREPFQPLPGPVSFVPYGDAAALDAAVDDTVAAVVVEPVQGEAGVVVPPDGYLAAARSACDRVGALLVVDEVQSGIGRTGAWFASTAQGVLPDVITLAKGLGGGLPIGACVGVGAAGELFAPGDHGSTFGGNPVSCAAALAVLDTIEADDLLTHVKVVGERLAGGLDATRHPLLAGHRGLGLWRALLLARPLAGAAETAARQAGFLVNAVRPDVVRLAPPLVLTAAEADSFVRALPAILDVAGAGS